MNIVYEHKGCCSEYYISHSIFIFYVPRANTAAIEKLTYKEKKRKTAAEDSKQSIFEQNNSHHEA